MKSETSKITFRIVLILALLWFIYIFKVLSKESHTIYTSYKLHYDSLAANSGFQQLPENLKHSSAHINTVLAKHHIISFEAYTIAVLLSGAVIAVLIFQTIKLIRSKNKAEA
jgi:hypothetical protein